MKKTILVMAMLSLGLSACSNYQECNDDKSKVAVLEILGQHFPEMPPAITEALKPVHAEAKLLDIKTTSKNKDLGQFQCSGTYAAKYKDQELKISVDYQLAHLEDSNTTETRVDTSNFRARFPGPFFQQISGEILAMNQNSLKEYLEKRNPQPPQDVATCFDSSVRAYFNHGGGYGNFGTEDFKKIEASCEKRIADEKVYEEEKAIKEREAEISLQEAVRVDRCVKDKFDAEGSKNSSFMPNEPLRLQFAAECSKQKN